MLKGVLRLEKTIEIGQGEDALAVTVREVTPLLAGKLHQAVFGALGAAGDKDADSLTSEDVFSLLLGDVPLRCELLAACTSLGDGVNEIGGTAFLAIWQAFEEVNAPFFEGLIRMLAHARRGRLQEPDSKPSSAGASAG